MTGIFSDKIPQHRHCEICGKAFIGEGHFCSDSCKESAGADAKKKIRKLMIIWIAIVTITVVAIAIIGL